MVGGSLKSGLVIILASYPLKNVTINVWYRLMLPSIYVFVLDTGAYFGGKI